MATKVMPYGLYTRPSLLMPKKGQNPLDMFDGEVANLSL